MSTENMGVDSPFVASNEKTIDAPLGDTEMRKIRETGGLPTTPAILEAIHLRKYFPLRSFNLLGPQKAVHAVEDSSLALYPGRALALVGESGSGKTTMARILARLYEPTAGTLAFR